MNNAGAQMALDNFLKINLPYCLKRQDDGSWIVLNREYKPLGFNSRDHVDYSAFPIATRYPALTLEMLERICVDTASNPNEIYLYCDRTTPTDSAEHMAAYLTRIQQLAALKVMDVR